MEYAWLPLTDDLEDSLKWLEAHRRFKEGPYVFVCDQPGPNYGQPFKVRRKFLKGLCKRAGVKPFGFHAMRRFVATILADKNVSMKQLQELLRHKKLHTTELYVGKINRDWAGTMSLLTKKKFTSKFTS